MDRDIENYFRRKAEDIRYKNWQIITQMKHDCNPDRDERLWLKGMYPWIVPIPECETRGKDTNTNA